MNFKDKIKEFNKDNKPFYIVDHDDGTFSLCLPLDLLDEAFRDYCQDAFDAFAAENGQPAVNGYFKTYGSGYDWQAAFQEAFKDDPDIGRVFYDCEAGGFFCYCNDLNIISDLGRRFKSICENYKEFAPIVSAGIRNARIREDAEEKLMKTVKGLLMRNPNAVFEIMTPSGNINITPDVSKGLLDGSVEFIDIGGARYFSSELLDQYVADRQTDLFDDNYIRVKTEETPEQEQVQKITM